MMIFHRKSWGFLAFLCVFIGIWGNAAALQAQGIVLRPFSCRHTLPLFSFGRNPCSCTTRAVATPKPLSESQDDFDTAWLEKMRNYPVQSREELLETIRTECGNAKKTQANIGPEELENTRKHLLRALETLDAELKKHRDRELTTHWEETLQLPRLRENLQHPGENTSAAASETYQEIQAISREFDIVIFHALRDALRRYLTVEIAAQSDNFSSDFSKVCDAIPGLVEKYLEGDRAEYVSSLRGVMQWFNDIGPFVPEAERLARCIEERIGRPNFYLHVGSGIISSALVRDVQEEFQVNETILGTHVQGTGTMHGRTSAGTAHNDRSAELRLKLNTQMTTETIGRKGPVRVYTENSGTAYSEKPIFIAPDRIFTQRANTRIQLDSKIKGLQVFGGALIHRLAWNLVQRQKPASVAEANRRAVRRINAEFDGQADPRIEELNQRYQDLLIDPMRATGRFPKVWDFRTTNDSLKFTALILNQFQVSTPEMPPELPGKADLCVHVHQSLFANLAFSGLAGRRVEELELLNRLEEKFPRLSEQIQRDEDQPPLTVIFAKKNPVSVLFSEDELTVSVHIDFFEREEQIFPGLDITLKYKLRIETRDQPGAATPQRVIVFEEASPPTAFPPGFDPEGAAKLSAREQIIRNIVLKHIERDLEKRFEISPVELGVHETHSGTLSPLHAASRNGWLTLAWTWDTEKSL